MSGQQWLRRRLALYLSVELSLSELRWLLLPSVFYPSVGISLSELRWLRRPSVLSVVSVLSAFGFLISQPPLRHVSVMAVVLYMVERTVDISRSGLRWLRRPSVLSVASVLSPFEPRASQPPLLPASVMVCLLMFV